MKCKSCGQNELQSILMIVTLGEWLCVFCHDWYWKLSLARLQTSGSLYSDSEIDRIEEQTLEAFEKAFDKLRKR